MSDSQNTNQAPDITGGLDLPIVIMVGLITTVVTIVTVIAAIAVYNANVRSGLENNQYLQRDATLEAYQADQQAKLADSVWVDLDKTTATVPIDLAISQYAKQQGGE